LLAAWQRKTIFIFFDPIGSKKWLIESSRQDFLFQLGKGRRAQAALEQPGHGEQIVKSAPQPVPYAIF
jgi:hypothetical protein